MPSEKPRLWVVCEVYYPEMTSTGYYLTAIAEGLADTFDIKVICGQPNYSRRGTKAANHELHNDVEIFRVWSTTLDKNVIVNRLVNMLTIGTAMLVKAFRHFRQGDRILVVTNPPSLPFTIALPALLRGASYNLLLHDVYPEQLVATGHARPDSSIVRLLHACNSWLYKHATRIIVVGRDMRELIATKTSGLDIPITVIPNWAELELVEPRERVGNELLRKLGIEDKFVFLYAGNLGRPNDIETIAACADLLGDDDRCHFVFVGDGAKKKWLETTIRELGLENISIVGPKPRNEQSIFLNACDVALISLVPGMWGKAMPSRTYNILAAGKPILALTDDGSELARVVDEEAVGWHIPPGDPELLRSTIVEILEKRDQIAGMSARSRNAAVTEYSAEAAIAAYKDVLK
ncbi:MAG TPA: glycosyltransferase family 4 protein [Pyrinomonadaceae bacterium]|jgi:glycosyltransferase involved in cell wall biosynthesis|nr:glycosyltransferase family 4 protein [Pyrinomonadaceae bacterium]